MLFEHVGAGEKHPGSLRAISPTPVADKCLMRRLDGGIHLLRATTLDDRDYLPRSRVLDRESVGIVA
jgi:hypothetical protein